jgi:pilus assembly protein CpaB
MDVKKLVLLIGALVVAAVTAVTARKIFTGASAPAAVAAAPVPAGPEVLVATKSLPVGTIIDAEALRYQRWPEGLVQTAYFIKGRPGASPQNLIGTVVRSEMTAGQPLTQGALIKPGERGFLAAALGPGMRAVTVPVSATSGVAGFVFPGDRVDVVLTQEVKGAGEGPPLKVSETIMRNLRVLATNQRMSPNDKDGKPVVEPFSLVTFEATPKMAEKIAVAQMIGQLSLSLRSLADNNADLQRAIASGEVATAKTGGAQGRLLLPVAGEAMEGKSTYTVGADVSRFQRSSVPSQTAAGGGEKASPMDVWAKTMTSLAAGGKPSQGAGGQQSVPVGPSVRVARGNSVTVVPVGAK